MAEVTAQDAAKLIKPTGGGADSGEPIEYEMDDFANMDGYNEAEAEAYMDEPATEGEPAAEAEGDEASSEEQRIDWETVASQQQQELERLRSEEAKRKQDDFERLLATKTPEEQVELLKTHISEQQRAADVARMRQEASQKHPLASILFGPISEVFDMEIEDPQAYSSAMANLEDKFGAIVNSVVSKRVEAEMQKFYEQAGKEWGMDKLGSSQPRPLQPRNPIRNQYEQTQKTLKESSKPKTTEDIATLIRQRERAKGMAR
jgi:hypothetical protein